jgi:circadian clock protein KaiC
MKHSNQIREYLLTGEGVKFVDAYLGTAGVLTGSARLAKEAQERVAAQQQQDEISRRRREIASQRLAVEHQIALLQAEIVAQDSEIARLATQEQQRMMSIETDRLAMGASRHVHANGADQHPAAAQGMHPGVSR